MPVKAVKTTKKDVTKPRTRASRRYLATLGRRKTAVAQVKLVTPGTGQVIVNKKELKIFFPYFTYQQLVVAPFVELGESGKYNVEATVKGGGVRGQAESIRLGIARALVELDAEKRRPLKARGFLKRDPRAKERKKPGRHRARRGHQWRKR